MAQFKNLIVTGNSRFIGTSTFNNIGGGTFTAPIYFTGSEALPSKTLSYVCGIDGFADGGQMGWQATSGLSVGSAAKLTNAKTIFGKSFNGTENVAGQGLFYGTYTATAANRYSQGGLQIREAGQVGNAQSDIGYAPTIGFHWGGRVAATLLMHSDGNFYFRKQDGVTRATVDANIIGNVTGNVTGSSGSCTGNAATATSAGKLTSNITFTPAETALTPANVKSLIGDNSQIRKGTWSYAGNGHIATGSTATSQCPFGVIDLAGTTVIQSTTGTEYTQVYITPPTASATGAIKGEMLYYIDQGSGYTPTWYRVLTNANYNNYAPSKTGTGASGTWGISITGNAATATKATQDGSGNTITSYYCTLGTTQTLSGAKTFTQPIGITTAAKMQYNSTDECLEFIFS